MPPSILKQIINLFESENYSVLVYFEQKESSFKSELIELENYNFKNLINLSKRIEKKSKVIIQYPTKSMGYSIAFLFLPWI